MAHGRGRSPRNCPSHSLCMSRCGVAMTFRVTSLRARGSSPEVARSGPRYSADLRAPARAACDAMLVVYATVPTSGQLAHQRLDSPKPEAQSKRKRAGRARRDVGRGARTIPGGSAGTRSSRVDAARIRGTVPDLERTGRQHRPVRPRRLGYSCDPGLARGLGLRHHAPSAALPDQGILRLRGR